MAMVRPSTQQTVDRILGTAAVISISVALVRWLSSQSSSSSHSLRRQDRKECAENDNNISTRWTWWRWSWLWPDRGAAALQSKWNDNEKQNRTQAYEHSGSCHCGSIHFLLQGSKRLHAIDTPGKIRFPHVSISANQFQLVRGEDQMRFYYEDTITDDSSSITFDILPGAPPSHTMDGSSNHASNDNHASCAFCFCGNCGVHVFHADRSLGVLEINAHCLDGGEAKLVYGEEEVDLQHASISSKHSLHGRSSSKAGTVIETVSENEPFLGGTLRPVHSYDNNNIDRVQLRTKESSISSSDPTQYDTYSTAMMAESDDLSMASSSIAGGVSLTQYHSLLSVASVGAPSAPASSSSSIRDRTDRTGLPPRPPSFSRISPSNRSVSTLPPWLDGRPGSYHGSRGGLNSMGGGVGSSWSVTSIESHEFDGMDTKSTISPRMRDQMKKYLSSHMSEKQRKVCK
ncbi:hypothetical protein ACHAWU_003589 [Discostella pseudostelligera]|uniref:Uncharacterized protein n=1 Tax=Discostella pseudostelligera TaxID=259834 RepID=A0ABD3N422_9STRA